jgi:DNA-binding LytR/AlgR family response regulator
MKSKKKTRSAKTTTWKVDPVLVKKPRGRPPKARPETPPATPPAPAPPTDNLKYLENLLIRLVSPLKSLPVQINEGVVYLRPEDIAYITTTAERKLLIVDREGKEWRRFDSIKDMKEKLAGDPRFFLSHKSFILNVYAVRSILKNPETKRQEATFGDQVKGVAAVSSGNMKELKDLLEL